MPVRLPLASLRNLQRQHQLARAGSDQDDQGARSRSILTGRYELDESRPAAASLERPGDSLGVPGTTSSKLPPPKPLRPPMRAASC